MFQHKTVLLRETVDGLNIKPDGTYVDCTLGGAEAQYIFIAAIIGKRTLDRL